MPAPGVPRRYPDGVWTVLLSQGFRVSICEPRICAPSRSTLVKPFDHRLPIPVLAHVARSRTASGRAAPAAGCTSSGVDHAWPSGATPAEFTIVLAGQTLGRQP